MKTITFIFLLMPFWTLNNLAQNTDVTGLLDKPETRTEIFNTILNDHQLMMEFMNAMKKNDHAMMMMKENSSIMGDDSKGDMEMGDEHHMMRMMMDSMMVMCEQDSIMCNEMIDMMSEHPHMIQMSMQKIKEKSMMEPSGKMKMMESKAPEESNEHHHHK